MLGPQGYCGSGERVEKNKNNQGVRTIFLKKEKLFLGWKRQKETTQEVYKIMNTVNFMNKERKKKELYSIANHRNLGSFNEIN